MFRKIASVLVLVFFLSIFSLGTDAFAGEGTAGDYFSGMGRNIGRGIWNIASSPAEIPCAMGPQISEHPSYGFFSGLGIGLGLMLRRIVVGASEVGTFVMPAEATIPGVCQEKPASATGVQTA